MTKEHSSPKRVRMFWRVAGCSPEHVEALQKHLVRVHVMLQVALSLVVVTGTGLFVGSFQHLLDVGRGIEP